MKKNTRTLQKIQTDFAVLQQLINTREVLTKGFINPELIRKVDKKIELIINRIN